MDRDKMRGIRRRIGIQRKAEDRIVIYFCNQCGIMEYLDHIVRGGKKCSGCKFIMETEIAGEE